MREMLYATVLRNEPLAEDVYDLHLTAPKAVTQAKAGQFLSIYTGNASMLLPRPLSICEANEPRGFFRVVYRVVGEGTREIAAFKTGDKVRMLGPLGSSYHIEDGHKCFALCGGGMGAPPMLALAKKIRKEVEGAQVSVFLGFRSKQQAILEEDFKNYADNVFVATDDGTQGIKGNIIDSLKSCEGDFDAIFGCGPQVMLKHLAKYATERNIPCHVSIEEHMACSVGACLACVCKVVTDDETGWTYKRVCNVGPVFNAKELVWE